MTDFFPYDFCDVNLCVDCFYFGSRITHGLISVHFCSFSMSLELIVSFPTPKFACDKKSIKK